MAIQETVETAECSPVCERFAPLHEYDIHAWNGEPMGSIFAASPEEAAVLSAKERDVYGRELLQIGDQWVMVVADSRSTRAFESVAPDARGRWDL